MYILLNITIVVVVVIVVAVVAVISTGRPNVYHTGSYSSYASRVTFFPTDGIGVWSAVSTDSSLFSQYDVNRFVSWFAIDLLLGESFQYVIIY